MGSNLYLSSVIDTIHEQNERIRKTLEPLHKQSLFLQQYKENIDKINETLRFKQQILNDIISPVYEQLQRINEVALSIHEVASSTSDIAAQIPKVPEVPELSKIVNTIPTVNFSAIPSVTSVLSQYASSIDRFKNTLNLATISVQPPSELMYPSLDFSDMDSLFDSSEDIIDDMAAQNWITESDRKSLRTAIQEIKEKLMPVGKKIWNFVAFLSVIAGLTGINLSDVVDHFQPEPQIEIRHLNDSEERIIIAQTDLINNFCNSLQSTQELSEIPQYE